jgi:hypothetical protein
MLRPNVFRDMKSAPMDGSPIEVQHGPGQAIVTADWNKATQRWMRKGGPQRRGLLRVTSWRPIER